VGVTVEGRPANDSASQASYKIIGPDYFRVFGMPILAGRNISDADGAGNAGVVVVSETLARALGAGQDPFGHAITPQFPRQDLYWLPRTGNLPGPGILPLTVIGVVGDVRQDGLPTGTAIQMYLPYLQNPSPFLHLAVRTRSDPLRWSGAVRAQVLA